MKKQVRERSATKPTVWRIKPPVHGQKSRSRPGVMHTRYGFAKNTMANDANKPSTHRYLQCYRVSVHLLHLLKTINSAAEQQCLFLFPHSSDYLKSNFSYFFQSWVEFSAEDATNTTGQSAILLRRWKKLTAGHRAGGKRSFVFFLSPTMNRILRPVKVRPC